MLCNRCGVKVEDGGMYCSECYDQLQIAQADNNRKLGELADAERRQAMAHTYRKLMPFIVGAIAIMTMFILAIVPNKVTTMELPTSDGYIERLCDGENTCIAVIMSPWCPACKSAVKSLPEMRDYILDNTDYDFALIIGLDDQDALENFRETVDLPAYFDSDGSVYQQSGARGVPAIIAINGEGEVLGKSGFMRGGSLKMRMDYIFEDLGLGN